MPPGSRAAALLKAAGIVLLAALLVEPLFTGVRPKPGNNLFLVLADNSKSLQLADRGHRESRGAAMKERLAENAPWLTRLWRRISTCGGMSSTLPSSRSRIFPS